MPQPHPDSDHYGEWLDTQIAIGDSLAADYQAITDTERQLLSNAVRSGVQWLGVPDVLRVVADTIAEIDRAEADADDCPF